MSIYSEVFTVVLREFSQRINGFSRVLNRKRSIGELCGVPDYVSKLTISDLLDWFKRENPRDRFTNIVIAPNKNFEFKLKMSSLISDNLDLFIFQIIYNQKKKQIITIRAVQYGIIESGLAQALADDGGVLIIKG